MAWTLDGRSREGLWWGTEPLPHGSALTRTDCGTHTSGGGRPWRIGVGTPWVVSGETTPSNQGSLFIEHLLCARHRWIPPTALRSPSLGRAQVGKLRHRGLTLVPAVGFEVGASQEEAARGGCGRVEAGWGQEPAWEVVRHTHRLVTRSRRTQTSRLMVQTVHSGVWQPHLGAKGDVARAGDTHPSRALLALDVHGRSLPGQGACFPRAQPHSEGRLGTEAPQPLKPRDLAPWCPLALKDAVPERLPGWDMDKAQAGASPVVAATSSPHLASCRVPAPLRIWAGSWRGPCPVHSLLPDTLRAGGDCPVPWP